MLEKTNSKSQFSEQKNIINHNINIISCISFLTFQSENTGDSFHRHTRHNYINSKKKLSIRAV